MLCVLGTHVSLSAKSIKHKFPMTITPKLRNVLVICVQYSSSAGGQRFNQLVFCPRDIGEGVEELQMNRGNIRHHPNFRLGDFQLDRKSTRLNSSHANISYAVFCLKKKKKLFRLTRYD